MATKLNGSILTGFEILDLITPERPEISADTVMRELGLTAATAHRFLVTLNKVGALASYRRGRYCLGPQIEHLGRAERQTNPLAAIAKSAIRAASRDLKDGVMVCRLSQAGPVCAGLSHSARSANANARIGMILPLHSTAQGKLWLSELSRKERKARLGAYSLVQVTERTHGNLNVLTAELDQIRRLGYAVNVGENEPDLGAVAVPVRSSTGKMILTLSTFGMVARFDDDFIANAVARLKSAAMGIQSKIFPS